MKNKIHKYKKKTREGIYCPLAEILTTVYQVWVWHCMHMFVYTYVQINHNEYVTNKLLFSVSTQGNEITMSIAIYYMYLLTSLTIWVVAT